MLYAVISIAVVLFINLILTINIKRSLSGKKSLTKQIKDTFVSKKAKIVDMDDPLEDLEI